MTSHGSHLQGVHCSSVRSGGGGGGERHSGLGTSVGEHLGIILTASTLSCSSYDFGYLVRLLTSQKLPDEEGDFFELMSIHFPRVYDVKYLMKSCKNLKGGLQEVAESLQVGRVTLVRGAGG